MVKVMNNLFQFFILIAIVTFGLIIILKLFLPNGNMAGYIGYPPPEDNIDRTLTTPIPYPPPENQPTPTPELHGPHCHIDRLNQFNLILPNGWHTDGPPDVNGVGGASVFYNYSRDEVTSDHGIVKLPPNAIKIQVSSTMILENETLEQWVNYIIDNTISSEQGKRYKTKATSPYTYDLAGYSGLAYSVSDSTGLTLLSINLPVGTKRILVITITPADSPSIIDAAALLETLNVRDFDSCSSAAKKPDEQVLNSELPTQSETITLKDEDFTCNLGTFPGGEAHKSTITLQMPFLINETWIVGGEGSFYGNNHHCNYYNSYYATDWNKPDGNDANALVLAVADGTVTFLDAQCSDVRYGCYVQVDHLSDFRTIYAHLSTVYVQVGVSVNVGQLIGKVGCTGNCADPHLHLGFWHNDLSDYPYHYEYFSQCYNGGQTCPNGEAGYYPQGYRPSPMWSSYGNAYLADGLPFTSVNGHNTFLPMVCLD